MFISVYAIAKNEEALCERWYNCFKEADEVCVLVNNSTDNTAEKLRSLGAHVAEKDYPHFRFDVARNDAMKLCSPKADLLFSCDFDDVIEAGWRKKVEHAWKLGVATGKNPNSILFTYSVFYGDDRPKQSFVRHSIHTPNGWYWKSRIHEYLEHRTRKEYIFYPKFEMVSKPIRAEHGSYLPLLEEECRDPNCEARSIHLLAREYLINKRYEDAIEGFERYLSHPGAVWNSERGAAMKFLSQCYGALGFKNAEELWLWKSMVENPKDRDAPFNLGNLLLLKKQYRIAKGVLERCCAIQEPELDYPYFTLEAWTERPFLMLAEAKFYCGDWDGAEKSIEKALTKNPNSELAKKMKQEIKRNRDEGRRPNLPPPEVPRGRIEIPELIQPTPLPS